MVFYISLWGGFKLCWMSKPTKDPRGDGAGHCILDTQGKFSGRGRILYTGYTDIVSLKAC